MHVSTDKIELAGEVVESGLTHSLYIRDERLWASYPGRLGDYGLKWKVGDKVKITIERESADPVGSQQKLSASESKATLPNTTPK